jgi:hypothetical protein
LFGDADYDVTVVVRKFPSFAVEGAVLSRERRESYCVERAISGYLGFPHILGIDPSAESFVE